jgi:hypothetical protein
MTLAASARDSDFPRISTQCASLLTGLHPSTIKSCDQESGDAQGINHSKLTPQESSI